MLVSKTIAYVKTRRRQCSQIFFCIQILNTVYDLRHTAIDHACLIIPNVKGITGITNGKVFVAYVGFPSCCSDVSRRAHLGRSGSHAEKDKKL